jgi:hypothetical protein
MTVLRKSECPSTVVIRHWDFAIRFALLQMTERRCGSPLDPLTAASFYQPNTMLDSIILRALSKSVPVSCM